MFKVKTNITFCYEKKRSVTAQLLCIENILIIKKRVIRTSKKTTDGKMMIGVLSYVDSTG